MLYTEVCYCSEDFDYFTNKLKNLNIKYSVEYIRVFDDSENPQSSLCAVVNYENDKKVVY